MTDHYSLFTQTKQDILLVKVTEIYIEYYKIKKEFIDYKDIFLKDYVKEYTETNNDNTNNTKSINEIIKTDIPKQEQIHTPLFNKLVLLTHPDKNSQSNPILYQQVKEAHEKNKFAKICFLAKFINVPIGELTDEEIKLLEDAIIKKKKKIEHYSKTYPVLYGRAKSDSVKERLLSSFKELNAP
jgi:hypothetical protein